MTNWTGPVTHVGVRHWSGTIPSLLHLLNYSRRPVIPDSEPTLNHRNRGLAGLEYNPQRFVIELIALGPGSGRTRFLRVRGRGFKNLHLIIGCALGSPKIAELAELGLGHKGSMQAAKFGTPRWHKQHIAGP